MKKIITLDEEMEDRLKRFREIAAPHIYQQQDDLWHELGSAYRFQSQRAAPSLPTVLATLPAAATANTFTTSQSILSSTTTNQTSIGPFSVDYFKTTGATWEQEAMGIISTTATPTFLMGTYYGIVVGTVTTLLCAIAAQTTASGLANVNWYYKAVGHTRTVTATTATMLVTGLFIGQLATAATGNSYLFATNATPPTAITTDLSTAVFIDLRATWGASSASNTTTVNFYNLKSLYA